MEPDEADQGSQPLPILDLIMEQIGDEEDDF